jgi:biopolymer transport protein ExbD
MSHAGSNTEAEPDLTPMLDLVMQLLMYFIMVANFIGQENNADVKLPIAQSAKPKSPNEGDVLFLNVNADGKVLIFGEAPKDMDGARLWLDNKALDAKRKSPDGVNRTAIVVRAHKDASYETVYRLMQTCKEKGFKHFKLRAIIREG